MRLLIKLQSTRDTPYEMQYHYHLQGFIYNLLKGSIYHDIHDMKGYKFFSFSNVLPPSDLKRNDYRTLIISSPDEQFIRYLYEALQLFLDGGTMIKIGIMNFKIDSLRIFQRTIQDSNFSLITGTPIIVRNSREKYKNEYRFELEKKYDEVYWRNGHPIDLFLSSLKENLLHKYAAFYGSMKSTSYNRIHRYLDRMYTSQLFTRWTFKKQISTRLFIKTSEQVIIGTTWEFGVNPNSKDLVQFGLDCGLGERNSLGFGFMN
jgi:CRISPR-associated endoribonuclease Cas6